MDFIRDLHPFHSDPDPDTGFQIFADLDPGYEIFDDPGLDFSQKLMFFISKK